MCETNKKMCFQVLLFSILVFAGCRQIPEGIEPVTGFELERYLGTWYEIARFDHWFERDLTNVTATYSLRENGTINVLNRGYNTVDESWDEANGKAKPVSDSDTGQLSVSFFWPFSSGYNVIALDHENYSWALVCSSSRSYLWILARETTLPDDILDDLLAYADELDFDTDSLIYVEHDPDEISNVQ